MATSEFPTLTTTRLRPLFAVLRRRGVDIDALLRQWGTDEATLLDPLHRMARDEVLSLLDHLGATEDRGELGLEAVTEMAAHDFDVLGHLLRSAATLGDALQQATRYVGLVHDAVGLELSVHGAEARVLHRIAGGRVQLPQIADFSVAMIVRLFREITGGVLPLLAVKLARPRPRRPERYRAWFGAPVIFDAACNELSIPTWALGHALPRADASLHSVLKRQADAQLPSRSEVSVESIFVERVRAQMAQGLERGDLTALDVARRLRVAERTLRRRLGESGTSYRELLDDVRRERALVLTQDPRLNLSQVARRLGFSGAGSFGRAVRRWKTKAAPADSRAARAG